MNERIKLYTNKYEASKDPKDVTEVEGRIVSEEDDGSILVEFDDGVKVCLKRIDKWLFVVASRPIFVAVYSGFLAFLFHYHLAVGLIFTVLTVTAVRFSRKIPSHVLRSVARVFFLFTVVAPIVSLLAGYPLPPTVSAFTFFMIVFLVSYIGVLEYMDRYEEVYLFCEDVRDDWSALFFYLFKNPKFYFWK